MEYGLDWTIAYQDLHNLFYKKYVDHQSTDWTSFQAVCCHLKYSNFNYDI